MSVKILIVEDERIVALDIQRNLEKFGFEVMGICSSSSETIERIKKKRPDLILMDIKIRGKIDGIDTAYKIQEEYRIPVILLTALADDSTLERIKKIGPFGYINKPYSEKELKTGVEVGLYRSQLEKKLWESEERYRRLFEDDLSADFLAGPDGRIIACNSSFVELFEFKDHEEALDSNINNLFPDLDSRKKFWGKLHAKRSIQLMDIDFLTTGAKTINSLANVIGSFDDRGLLVEVKGYVINVTDRKKLEKQLMDIHKMEAIGRLAGGIAHDFNNVLTIVLGYLSMINEKKTDGDAIDIELEGIKDAVVRATNLTRQLLAFSRRQVLHPTIADINQLIRNMNKMLERLLTEEITLSIQLSPQTQKVRVDTTQFEQILINLIVNARDAIPDGGKVFIQTETIHIENSIVSLMGEIPPGKYVLLQVRDTGIGIRQENLPHIFEPFFTTKSEESGTGLGLATVYGILQQSNAFAVVNSSDKRGTAFKIYFKAVEDEIVETDSKKIDTAPGGDETILIVEDDHAVNTMLTSVLLRKGYTVLSADNPGEALMISEKYEKQIDLLLTDIVLPYIDGFQLYERFIAMRPGVKVVFTSGYPENTKLIDRIKELNLTFLAKPIERNSLLTHLDSVLHS